MKKCKGDKIISNEQKLLSLDDELRTSCKLLQLGLGGLQNIDMAEDFYQLPFQLLSSGLERLMKCYVCLVFEASHGKYPDKDYLRKDLGHDLLKLKQTILEKYFRTNNKPALKEDVKFLNKNPLLDKVLHILSEFGKFTRYYNLDIVTGNSKTTDPRSEWEKLEMDILKAIPGFCPDLLTENGEIYYQKINMQIVKVIERFIRAISRQFTLGQHGKKLQQLSVTYNVFRNLQDSELGQKKY